MSRLNFQEDLTTLCGAEHVEFSASLSDYTSFRIGGPADALVRASSAEELAAVQEFAASREIPLFFLGKGSNLLVNDEGFRGIVLTAGEGLSRIDVSGETLCAGCGSSLARIAAVALEHNLTGFEFAAGIPGSLGGAVYMNAGAYGGEMKQVLDTIEYLDGEGLHQMKVEDADFSYRHSYFMSHPCIITSATIHLTPGDHNEIHGKMQDLAGRRREKQPLEYPSAGSMFKRPEGYFAGKLVQDAGLAGFRIGGAEISTKHCGFVINVQGATCKDVVALDQAVHQRVFEQFGVEIWPEVRYLGPVGLCPMPGLEEPEV